MTTDDDALLAMATLMDYLVERCDDSDAMFSGHVVRSEVEAFVIVALDDTGKKIEAMVAEFEDSLGDEKDAWAMIAIEGTD